MITPSFAITATERVLPRLALDFTTAILDSRVTLTRVGNTATVTNSSGVIVGINANLPRFDYDPVTLICKGLLVEEARTNLLLNSLINGTNLTTQIVTTTAVAHTLSFYGTGQIVLSGTSSATVVGTGAYPSRRTLTFTPTAGALTLTVTGTVQFAQLEAGAFATSYIPTVASQVTRTADVATMTGTNFSNWYNASEGAFQVQTSVIARNIATGNFFLEAGDGGFNNRMYVLLTTGGTLRYSVDSSAARLFNLDMAGITFQSPFSVDFTYKNNSYASSTRGTNLQTNSSGAVPTVTTLYIGRQGGGGGYINGWYQKLNYWPQRITNNEILAFSK